MDRLSVDDLHAFHHAILDLHRYRDLDEFLEFAPRVLSRLIPSARFSVQLPDSEAGAPRVMVRRTATREPLPQHDPEERAMPADASSRRGRDLHLDRAPGATISKPRDQVLLELLQPHLEMACLNARQVTASRTAMRNPDVSNFGLTPREHEVAQWLALGKTNAEIARILGASARTIEKHVERVLLKMGVENRTSAALLFSLGKARE